MDLTKLVNLLPGDGQYLRESVSGGVYLAWEEAGYFERRTVHQRVGSIATAALKNFDRTAASDYRKFWLWLNQRDEKVVTRLTGLDKPSVISRLDHFLRAIRVEKHRSGTVAFLDWFLAEKKRNGGEAPRAFACLQMLEKEIQADEDALDDRAWMGGDEHGLGSLAQLERQVSYL